MRRATPVFSIAFLFCCVFFSSINESHAGGPAPVTCYAAALRGRPSRVEGRTKAKGYKGDEQLLMKIALKKCQSRYPKSQYFTCVEARCL